MYKFWLQVDRSHSDEVYNLLAENGIGPPYTIILKEAVGAPELIFIAAASLNIIDILRKWYKERKRQASTLEMRIYKYDSSTDDMGDEIYEFKTKSIKEIERELGK